MLKKPTYHELEQRVKELEKTEAKLRNAQAILEKRFTILPPLIDIEQDIDFDDLFNLEEIQRLQDQFAEATGVASIITTPDGKPITKPSNFCRLCNDIIRQTKRGRLNCYRSDKEIGKLNLNGPTISPCLSGGLWDSGAGISVDGKHLANWLMGQVRDETQNENNIRAYAKTIGADEEEAVKAFHEVPSMSGEKFKRISHFLYTLANQLSLLAFQNVVKAKAISRLKKSEDSLRQSEAYYRTLIETIPDLVWVKDPDGIYLSCNNEFEKFFGVKESEIVGKTDYDFVDRDTANFFRSSDQKAIGKNAPSTNEGWLTFAGNGYRGLFETIKTQLRDATGNLVGILGIAHDITRLKEKDHELRQIFTMSLDMICIADIETASFTKVNPACCRILGYSENELLEKSFLDFIHPDDVDETTLAIKNALGKGQKIINFINRYICKDGSIKWLSWVSHPEMETGLTYAIARDITEELAVSQALSVSEQRFRSIIESSPMGILIYELQPDNELILLGTNDTADQILGVKTKELIGLTIERAFPSLAKTEIPGKFKAICRNGSSWNTEQVNYHDAHVSGAYEVHAFQTNQNQVAVFFLDITDRIITEKEREILQKKLVHSQKMDAIGQLAGGIAHDFNNMLTGIKGATELLGLTVKDNPKATKYIGIIDNASDRASSLIKKLLAFGRKGKQLSSLLNIHTLILDTLNILERSIDKRIRIDTELEARQCQLTGDPSQLQSSLLNLFINARDAMPDGGVLHISTKNIQIDKAYCLGKSGITPGEHILISVQDTGLGIRPEIQLHIFEPFFTTKETGKGTGLGLAAVYGTIKDHSGEISVDSELGSGTIFKIILPASSSEKDAHVNLDQNQVVHGSGTILLVDDEEIIRSTGAHLLHKLGYIVILAENGQRAVEVYKDHMTDIDLVILDIVMPIMDGREAYKLIRSVNPDIPIIISSGFAKDVSMTDILKDRRVKFMMKPFSFGDLSTLVAESLR